MLATVDLDHKALFETDKIENVVFEWYLSAKLESGDPTIPQQAPHCGFSIGWFVPHVLRELAETLGDWPMGWLLRHEPLTRLSVYPPPELPSPTRGEGTTTCVALVATG
ncbi:hypothetical protein GGD62_002284 [Bradyrhizobium sp. ERR14]|nr:hypothetical protein [Bradyrhizobium sp. ERR14]